MERCENKELKETITNHVIKYDENGNLICSREIIERQRKKHEIELLPGKREKECDL